MLSSKQLPPHKQPLATHGELVLEVLLLRLQLLLLGVEVAEAALLRGQRVQQLVTLLVQLGVLVLQLFAQLLFLLESVEGLLGLLLEGLEERRKTSDGIVAVMLC